MGYANNVNLLGKRSNTNTEASMDVSIQVDVKTTKYMWMPVTTMQDKSNNKK